MQQRGSALVVALVSLAMLSLAAISVAAAALGLTQSTSNQAFRKAALQAAEVAAARAFAALRAGASLEVDDAPQYFATEQPVDAAGLPVTADWSRVPAESVGNYRVQWVAERLCSATPAVNPDAQCRTDYGGSAGSRRVGAPQFQTTSSIYYRVTSRATGPRGTEVFLQTLVSL